MGAGLVDLFLCALICAAIGFPLFMGLAFLAMFLDKMVQGPPGLLGEFLVVVIFTLFGAVMLSIPALYHVYFWTRSGATPGKRLGQLRVISSDGSDLRWPQALGRFFGYVVSCVFWLGFLWIAFDRNKQGWHDKLAGTYVVRFPPPNRS